MGGRTNKQWIASKKAQQAKQANRTRWTKRFEYPKRNIDIDEAMNQWVIWVQTNPRGNTFHRFLRWRKICWETRQRIDTDGYRVVRLPSGWVDYIQIMQSGWIRRRIMKTLKYKK
jgi:hypothetical protein